MSAADFLGFDDHLVEHGFPPLGDYWRTEATRFRDHPTALVQGERVGRGGAKSTYGVKNAVFETVFGDWVIPPGERHYFAFVSENKDEAAGRLRLIEAILTALHVPFSRAGDVIDLVDLPRGFRVMACRVGAVSGFRCFGWVADEAAKWESDDSSANPAREVIASIKAMTVTHPKARGWIVSSPFSTTDYHCEVIDRGDTASTVVGSAPSWVANPSISEAQTRLLEPDPRIWSREYQAIPQASVSSAFDPDEVDRAIRPVPANAWFGEKVLIIDPSSGGGDAFTYGVACWGFALEHEADFFQQGGRNVYRVRTDATGKPIPNRSLDGLSPRFFTLSEVGAFEGKFNGGTAIVDSLTRFCKQRGIRFAFGDQRESLMLTADFGQRGITYVAHPWTAANKPAAVERLRAWFRDRAIVLPKHDKLRTELLRFEEKITGSGYVTYGARGRGHDDYVALLLSAAIADNAGHISGSPYRAGYAEALAFERRKRQVENDVNIRRALVGLTPDEEADIRQENWRRVLYADNPEALKALGLK